MFPYFQILFFMAIDHGQPFPLSKLIFMFVKSFARPIASRIIKKAKKDAWFRSYVCLPPANLYHFYETKVKVKMLSLGRGKVTKVPKMEEKKSIELGANLISEFVIFAGASTLAMREFLKYKARERDKEDEFEKDHLSLVDSIRVLDTIANSNVGATEGLENILNDVKSGLKD